MRTIEIEDDVYEAIRERTVEIGESASSILRRELGLTQSREAVTTTGEELDAVTEELLRFVERPVFSIKRATDQYLAVLSFLHEKHGEEFDRILEVSGRRRNYFGRSPDEILRSGKSTHPRRIPNSNYWAMTNASTLNKRRMLRQVLAALGYEEAVAHRVAAGVRSAYSND